jgi:hypothetical protein
MYRTEYQCRYGIDHKKSFTQVDMSFGLKKSEIFYHLNFYIFCGLDLDQDSANPNPNLDWLIRIRHQQCEQGRYLIQVVHARAHEEGLQAAVLAQQDIRVRPVHTHPEIKRAGKPGEGHHYPFEAEGSKVETKCLTTFSLATNQCWGSGSGTGSGSTRQQKSLAPFQFYSL